MRTASMTALALALTAGAAGAQDQMKVTFFDLGPERQAFNEEVIAAFEAANPDIDVEYSWQANEPYKTGIKVMLDSDSPPDVFFNWAGSWAQDFVDAGYVMNLQPELEAGAAWADGLPEGILNQFRDENGLWGVPFEIYTKFLWRNDAFFEANGLENPATLDDLLGLCTQIREIDPAMTPIAFGASESWTINHYLTILFQRHVPAEVTAADFRLAGDPATLFTDPGYEAALADFKSMIDGGCFNEGINSVTPDVARTMFASELSAMTYCGSWCPPMFDEQGLEGGYSAMPFPATSSTAGDQTGNFVGVQGYQVSARAEHPEAALRFLAFLLSPDSQALMARTMGRLPSNGSALQEGDVSPIMVGLLDRLDDSPVSVPPLNTIVENSVSDVILKAGQDFVAGTIDAAGFMEQVRAQAQTAAAL
jgi:raffinose/stachyose/melibiose transport system substrate-binding protein